MYFPKLFCMCWLNIRGNDFIACSAYAETISSLAELTRKCLKVKYVGRIEYDIKKSRVAGHRDHKDSISAKKVFKARHDDFVMEVYYRLRRLYQKGEKYNIKKNNCLDSQLRLDEITVQSRCVMS